MVATLQTLTLIDTTILHSQAIGCESIESTVAGIVLDVARLSQEAAALAIANGDVRLAVTLLEQGRAVVYSQLGGVGGPFRVLTNASPQLAAHVSQLCAEIHELNFHPWKPNSEQAFVWEHPPDAMKRFVFFCQAVGIC